MPVAASAPPVTVSGLTSAEAAARLQVDGPNTVASAPRQHVASRIVR
ncbi:cation-transporting P-type ATPase [Micromonospora purpureochromogenes]